MPWQQLVADVAGELVRDEETGLWVPAYPEVVLTVPRQSGKTTLVLVWELDRALLWEAYDRKPQSIAYTAQSGSEARKKVRKDQIPLIRRSPFWAGVDRPRYAAEDTGIDFTNGSLLTVWSNSEDAGHGSVVDLGVMDEIFADEDNRREQALVPAMATRHDRQKLVTSTAGTDKSTLYLRKQAAGRTAVANQVTTGIAYFEWSAPEDADPEDPKTWWATMPALGHTQSERAVRQALIEMRDEDGDLAEFSRAWLNIPKRSGGDRVIPAEVWVSVLDPKAVPKGRMFLAVDGPPDHSSVSVGLADMAGACEVLMHGDGVAWVRPKLVEAARSLKAPVVVDVTGPVGHLADQLETDGVKVVRFQARDVVHACAELFTRIADGRLRVRPNACDHCGHVTISTAVEGVARQPVGDGWKWSRKTVNTDISPLMAVTLAVGATAGLGGAKPPSAPMVAFT